MKLTCALALAASVAACSSEADRAQDHVARCWIAIPESDNRVRLHDAEAIYLRGETVIVPSSRCDGERLQSVDQTLSVEAVLNRLGRRNVQTPLGFRATILATVLRRPSPHVVEIKLIELNDLEALSQPQSEQVLRRSSSGSQ